MSIRYYLIASETHLLDSPMILWRKERDTLPSHTMETRYEEYFKTARLQLCPFTASVTVGSTL